MIRFKLWTDGSVGIIEPTGSLDDYAVPELRSAIAKAEADAGNPFVILVEDDINATSEAAAGALVRECIRLRKAGGDLVVVSTDGKITKLGRPSNLTLFMPAFNMLDNARRSFTTRTSRSGQP